MRNKRVWMTACMMAAALAISGAPVTGWAAEEATATETQQTQQLSAGYYSVYAKAVQVSDTSSTSMMNGVIKAAHATVSEDGTVTLTITAQGMTVMGVKAYMTGLQYQDADENWVDAETSGTIEGTTYAENFSFPVDPTAEYTIVKVTSNGMSVSQQVALVVDWDSATLVEEETAQDETSQDSSSQEENNTSEKESSQPATGSDETASQTTVAQEATSAATTTTTTTTKATTTKGTIKTKVSKKVLKASALKKGAKTFQIGASISTKQTLTYQVTKTPSKGKKYITVSKSGKVTVKKNAPKGTYKIRVTAKASGSNAKVTKTVTVLVK